MRTATLFLILVTLVAPGCQQQSTTGLVEAMTVETEGSSPTAIPEPVEIAPQSTSPPPLPITAVPTIRPTGTPQLSPSPIPAKRVRVVVPAQWEQPVNQAVVAASEADRTVAWEPVVVDADEQSVQPGLGDIALTLGEEQGIRVLQDPLALAVPWTTDWSGVGLDQARQILDQGHTLVTVMPWRRLSPTLRPLRVDGKLPLDDGYPINDDWSLVSLPGFQKEANLLASHLRQAFLAQPIIHLKAVGDIMLDRSLGNAIQQGNLAYPFLHVADHLRNADVTVGNLESSLGDGGQPAGKHYTFRAPPEAAAALAQAGFDLMSLANNHAMDYGPETLIQGMSLLRSQGVATVGAGATATEAYGATFLNVNGLEVAFLGYVNVPVEVGGFDTASWTATDEMPGLAWATFEAIRAGVSASRSEADLVVVLLHSGFEYVEEPSEAQVASAHAAIEAGADLVLGHHAHLLQGIEFYRDGVIVYGLGNFAFQIEGPPESAILDLWLDREGVRQIELTPVVVQFGGQPRLADGFEASGIRRRVGFLTNLLNAP